MNDQKSPFLEKFYMLVVILLPVLAQYQLGPLDLDVVAMLVVLVVGLLTQRHLHITSLKQAVAAYVLYTALVAVINMVAGQKFATNSEILLRMGRYCLYLLIVFVLGEEWIDYRQFMKLYRIVALAAVGFVVLQAALYYGAGITLSGRLGRGEGTTAENAGRLYAFFSEPAELSYCITPFVVCSLFGQRYTKKDYRLLDALLGTAAVILSTSGQGVICIAAVWAIWAVRSFVKKTLSLHYLFVVVLGVGMVAVLFATGTLEFTIGRLEDGRGSNAWQARSGGYDALVLLSPMQRIFGAGYGNYFSENIYNLDTYGLFVNFSSIAESLFAQGYLGTFFIALFLLWVFRRSCAYSRVLIVAMLILSVGGSPFTGKCFPLYVTLMLCAIKKQTLPAPTPKGETV